MNFLDFELLNDVNEIEEVCGKHGCRLFQFKSMKPFCKECVKEKNQEDNERMGREGNRGIFEKNFIRMAR